VETKFISFERYFYFVSISIWEVLFRVIPVSVSTCNPVSVNGFIGALLVTIGVSGVQEMVHLYYLSAINIPTWSSSSNKLMTIDNCDTSQIVSA